MSEAESIHGLTCPQCGGVVPVPEGQAIVICPYCNLRSFVRGERGLRRYQVPQRVDRQAAAGALAGFFSRSWAIARDAARRAQLSEAFLVYLPFWTVWGRAAAWTFGQKRVGSGDHKRYEPREARVVQELSWNGAACDVGEFGVTRVALSDGSLEPFDPVALHERGMVFEPVGSFGEAQSAAQRQFEAQIRDRAGLDRVSQVFARFFRRRAGLVYYPLWVLRYLYRGRAFQVVVDGHTGGVLYGKAPGNTVYRAAALVGGMALGAFLAVDASALAFYFGSGSDSDGAAGFGLVLLLAGLGIMAAAYRAFRYGEQFEYRSSPRAASSGGAVSLPGLEDLGSLDLKDVEKWIDRLS